MNINLNEHHLSKSVHARQIHKDSIALNPYLEKLEEILSKILDQGVKIGKCVKRSKGAAVVIGIELFFANSLNVGEGDLAEDMSLYDGKSVNYEFIPMYDGEKWVYVYIPLNEGETFNFEYEPIYDNEELRFEYIPVINEKKIDYKDLPTFDKNFIDNIFLSKVNGILFSEGMGNLNPNKIRFSQSSVNGSQEIIESMAKNGWVGDPIDVIRMSDGGLTTIDNTRVVAARAAGIDVQAVIHNADDLLPEHLIERFTTKKGVPTTWGEAIELRIGKQNSGFRTNNPYGSLKWRRLNKMITKLPKEFIEKGFEYPEAYTKIIELNLTDFDFWYIMSEEQALKRLTGLRQRYPERYLVPFARRDDNDDIACFDLSEPDKVQIIHDFASSGYEQRRTYEDLWEWLKDSVNELIENNR